ncbi:MAG: fasciclin domain-containing protein [Bacteroidales bacterium]
MNSRIIIKFIISLTSMKPYIRRTLSVSLILYLIFLVSCKEEDNIDKPFYEIDEIEYKTISEYINSKGDTFNLFRSLINAGELESTLAAYNPFGNGYTLFLPSNTAVNQFIEDNHTYGNFQDLLNDQEYVRTLVRYHVANLALNANDFPLGSLPDTTLSGDLLTIGFSGDLGSLVQVVNNYATVIDPNIYLINGYIHIIDEVLEPVTDNSYEWLKNNADFSIITQALEATELSDTFNIVSGKNISSGSSNTLLVESDDVFRERSIFSIDDLINRYSPDNQEYTSSENGLYQFVAYHILEGRYFLNNFEGENTNYNTYTNLPVSVNATGVDIKINSGVEIFDTIIIGTDTSFIDFISLKYDKSNVLTTNGAIHLIDRVMELYKPRARQRVFQFYEEPLIDLVSQSPNTYEFNDPDKFEVIGWEGVDFIQYVKSLSDLEGVTNNDYIEIEGDFSIIYDLPKILPGNYMLSLRANVGSPDNAFIQIFLDGKAIGGNIDLTSSPGSGSFYTYDIGQLSFINHEKHQLRIQTLIPGRLQWDAVIIQPISN